MKKITFFLITMLLMAINVFAMHKKGTSNNINFEGYTQSWEKVEAFDAEGKPKSALAEVKIIALQARKEQNSPQLVKALLHQFKYEMVLEENAELKIVGTIRAEILSTDDVIAKSILQSILAESMWQYYQENRYIFLDRTQTTTSKEDDFQTWDLPKLLSEIRSNYLASIEAETQLKAANIELFDAILLKSTESSLYRPTIYDLLAHRAIDFFSNSESGLPEPVVAFNLNNPDYFQPIESFIQIKLPEELSDLDNDALQVFQQLLAFRLKQNNVKALVDADLKRLNYLWNNTTLENKDVLYLTGLTHLAQQYKNDDITAYVNYQIASFWNNKSTTEGETKGLRAKAVELCNETIAAYPKSFGANNCQVLLNNILQKTISAETESIVMPNQPFKALIQYQNIDKAYFKIVRLTEDEIGNETFYNERDKWLEKILKRTAVKEWSVTIPNLQDYHTHSTEIKADGLPIGTYMLFISHDNFQESVSLVSELWSSDISYVNRTKTTGGLEFYVMSRAKGTPLQGAKVSVYYDEYDYQQRKNITKKQGSYVTDKNGFFEVLSAPNQNRSVYLDIEFKEDRLNEKKRHYVYQYRAPEEYWSTNTYFFTDRAIYRPGQTIYFKGIMLRTNGEKHTIEANTKTTVTFRDVNYQEIATLELMSNEFGSFQGSFIAPSSGLTGGMTIIGTGGETYIQVEEYKRPTFEVILDTVKGSYSLNQKVTVTGKGMSYAGAPLIESQVKYRVVREVIYPYWYWWSWRRPSYSSESKEIANGETQTAQDGSYSVTFETVPDATVNKKDQPQFRYTVYIDIVDISGETRSGQKTITAGYVGLNLNVDVPQNWNRNEKQNIEVTTTNLDGRKESAEVTLKLYQLTPPNQLKKARLWEMPDQFVMNATEHDKWFPNDVYQSETNKEDWPKDLVKTYTINTGVTTKVEVLPATIATSGMYWVEATTKDDAGNTIEAKNSFVAVTATDKKLAQPDFLKLSLDKTSYEPGETAIVSIGTSVQQAKIIYLLSFDGAIIDQQFLELNNEIKQIKVPVNANQRGGLQVQCIMVYDNRVYQQNDMIDVPFENQSLEVEWMTFRDLLEPGQKEQWKLKIKGPKGDVVASELLAGMYDKSLDYFMPHQYNFPIDLNPRRNYASGFNSTSAFNKLIAQNWKNSYSDNSLYINVPVYDQLDLFGFYLGYQRWHYNMVYSEVSDHRREKGQNEGIFPAAEAKIVAVEDNIEREEAAADGFGGNEGSNSEPNANPSESETSFSPRKNLNETAFFFPQLTTNAEGEVIIDFTIPEALTTWKFLGFAHNKSLQHQIFTKEVKTQKDLMITPNMPRFFREGDKITLTAKIDNLSENALSGKATLVLKDALTNEVIDQLLLAGSNEMAFQTDAKGSTVVKWNLSIPTTVQAVTYEVYAKAGNFTDGVTSTVPVLTNRMLVTETMPVWLKKAGSRIFNFKSLAENTSKTLKHHELTLEYTSNPAWYAVQALPYLMEFPHECTEQLFSRYYANSLAEHIATTNPRIQGIFDQWKNANSDALISNLEKNQELKALLIEETPWLRNAQNETERKKRIALLFDLNRMTNEKSTILKKLVERQTPNGGFTWFPGMRDDRYITQHILAEIAHLKQLNITGAINDPSIQTIIERAIPYLDARLAEDLEEIKKHSKNWKTEDHLGSIQIHYLYMRGQFKEIPMPNATQEAFDYFLGQASKYWLNRDFYQQGMIAIALHHYDKSENAKKIMESIKEHSIVNDEMGMYWKAIEQGGMYWYNAPIESHALLIEAFHTVTNDQDAVNEMKVWLLKQKQVQDWKTTKATSEAIFALLLRGDDWLANTQPAEIKVGGKIVDPAKFDATYEAGTGYFKVKWKGEEVKKDMSTVTVTSAVNAPSWGAMYWQYFEDLDQIKTFEETPLELKKVVYKETMTNSGPVITPIESAGDLKPGDKLKVRIELRVDRNMEYVHMKDMRGSGLEPINVISQYKYQGGLGYYESTKDAATHFFFDYLPKGTYVFEYPLRVTHEGDFSNGITTIQSMYAPEFSSHSEGIRVQVK
jgi:uncharacterized protein YfaS (alpha-2-macroglobulin family)